MRNDGTLCNMILHVGRIMALPTMKNMNQVLNGSVQQWYVATLCYCADDSGDENIEKLDDFGSDSILLIIYRILASIG